MRDTLAALIERVERATGPDRELDAEIGALVMKNGCIREADGRQFQIQPHPRRYTASLDAAVSLVPEGWAWCVHDVGIASLMRAPRVVKATAATPALALCAAALRARMESADAR